MYQEYHDGIKEMSATLDTVIDMLKERQNVASQRAASFNSMSGNQFRGQRYQDNKNFYGTNLRLNQYGYVENQQYQSVPQGYPIQSPRFYSDNASYGWDDAYTQVPEAPVQQVDYSRFEMKLQQIIDAQQRCLDEINKPRPWEISRPAVSVAEEMNQEEVVESKVEEKVGFVEIGPLSVDSDESVDRQEANPGQSPPFVQLSIDSGKSVDRQKMFSGQSSSFVHLSIDSGGTVDRQQPSHPVSDVLTSLDASEPPPEPPERVPELLNPDPDPEPPEPDPKPPDHHETELVGVLPEEAATPGSCHKRKIPDTTLQPPLKLLRAYTGAAIIPAAAYLPDPGDTFAVYSRGPRPPPLEQWYVLFDLPSPSAGKHSHPPRCALPAAAYPFDPEKTDAVYHMGPRPP